MAAADYRLCDVCDGKVFYDANLNYERGGDDKWAKRKAPFRWAGEDQGKPENDDWLLRLDYLGDWAVICSNCAKTHKTIVVPLYAAPVPPQEDRNVWQQIIPEDAPQSEPKCEPLSDDDINKLAWKQNLWTDGMTEFSFLAFAREVERAHGIGGSDDTK